MDQKHTELLAQLQQALMEFRPGQSRIHAVVLGGETGETFIFTISIHYPNQAVAVDYSTAAVILEVLRQPARP